jgi:hypothetical protein
MDADLLTIDAATRSTLLSDRAFHSTDEGTAFKLAAVTAVACVVVMLGLAFIANLIG